MRLASRTSECGKRWHGHSWDLKQQQEPFQEAMGQKRERQVQTQPTSTLASSLPSQCWAQLALGESRQQTHWPQQATGALQRSCSCSLGLCGGQPSCRSRCWDLWELDFTGQSNSPARASGSSHGTKTLSLNTPPLRQHPGFPGGSVGKDPPAMQETQEMRVPPLDQGAALEEEVATHVDW